MFKNVTLEEKGLWKRFYLSQLEKYWPIYLGGVLAVMLTNITEVLVPKLSQWAIDLVSGSSESLPTFISEHENPLVLLGMLLGLNILVGFFTRAAWRQFLGKRTHYAAKEIRKQLWRAIARGELSIFSRYPIGDLVNRNITDVNPARFILGFTLVMSSDILFFCLLGSIMILQIHPGIGFGVILCFAFLPVLVYPIIKKEYDLHATAQEALSGLSDSISQMLGSIRLIKITGMDRPWLTRLSGESKQYSSHQLELEKTALKVFPISNALIILAYVIIFSVGVFELRQGGLSPGEFVALVSLVSLVSGPVTELAANILEWQTGISSLDRICEIIALEGEDKSHSAKGDENQKIETGSFHPSQIKPATLEITNLGFAYRASEPAVLSQISEKLIQGDSVGITGKVGSGKSTLLNILAGLEKVRSGHVFVNGFDLATLSRKDVASLVSIVSQVPFLFAGSVRENLSLETSFSDQQLWSILEGVGLKRDFEAFEEGLDTQIGEWGISLSGGQKQRLALARNLLRPRPIMLFDDCLSAVDTKTEALVQQTIKNIAKDSIMIWVAHRASTVSSCDKIGELKDGRISYD